MGWGLLQIIVRASDARRDGRERHDVAISRLWEFMRSFFTDLRRDLPLFLLLLWDARIAHVTRPTEGRSKGMTGFVFLHFTGRNGWAGQRAEEKEQNERDAEAEAATGKGKKERCRVGKSAAPLTT